MTLRAFFDLIAANPFFLLVFFLLLPFTAVLAGWLGKGEGEMSPWKYLYSALVYLSAIPGIFALTLNIYLFLFERQSIWAMDLYTQVLPILSMIATLLIIRQNVPLDAVPGFERISGLLLIIFVSFSLLWLIDRTHLVVFTYMPFFQVALIFLGLLLLLRFGVKRIFQ